MKTAKARVLMFDLECPYCDDGLLASPEGQGSCSWSIHETADQVATCVDCLKESKVPSSVPGAKIFVYPTVKK